MRTQWDPPPHIKQFANFVTRMDTNEFLLPLGVTDITRLAEEQASSSGVGSTTQKLPIRHNVTRTGALSSKSTNLFPSYGSS